MPKLSRSFSLPVTLSNLNPNSKKRKLFGRGRRPVVTETVDLDPNIVIDNDRRDGNPITIVNVTGNLNGDRTRDRTTTTSSGVDDDSARVVFSGEANKEEVSLRVYPCRLDFLLRD
jgi:hypothetical protein